VTPAEGRWGVFVLFVSGPLTLSSRTAVYDVCVQSPGVPRLLVLNYPSNPTGGTYTNDELAEMAEVLRRFQVLALADEIYADTFFDGVGKCPSLSDHYPEGTVVLGGASKNLGAGGWRMGVYAGICREAQSILR
jgi:aspartate/methionine/tyrosine aminotransferase